VFLLIISQATRVVERSDYVKIYPLMIIEFLDS